MDSLMPFAFVVPVLMLGVFVLYREINDFQRKELTASQISFLRDAAKGNAAAEQLVANHLCEKLSPREYANLRCRIDVLVSSEHKANRHRRNSQ